MYFPIFAHQSKAKENEFAKPSNVSFKRSYEG